MRLNITEPGHSAKASRDPLQKRVASFASPAVEHSAPSPDEVALRREARERLTSGQQDNRRTGNKGRDGSAGKKSSKSWPLWVVFDILLLLLIVPVVIAVPPVLDCRRIQQEIGFFAGNSFEKCAVKGISERWNILDSRLKMIVRGSGQ